MGSGDWGERIPYEVVQSYNPIKKAFGGKKFAPNGSRSENVAPQMVADQEVGSSHLFLSVCLIAELKRDGRVSHSILLLLDYKYSILIIKICRVGSLYRE